MDSWLQVRRDYKDAAAANPVAVRARGWYHSRLSIGQVNKSVSPIVEGFQQMDVASERVYEQWKEFDLEHRRSEYDGVVEQITIEKDKFVEQRKTLAALTKQFKSNVGYVVVFKSIPSFLPLVVWAVALRLLVFFWLFIDWGNGNGRQSSNTEEFLALLKRYQSCIDQLHARTTRAESAFMQMYSKLGTIADPAPVLARLRALATSVTVPAAVAQESAVDEETLQQMRDELQSLREQRGALTAKLADSRRKRKEIKADMLRLRATLEDLDNTTRANLRDRERREADLVRERDQALAREEAAKRERDEWAQRSFNVSQIADDSPFAVELALDSRQASLYAAEGRDAMLREQIAVAKREAARKDAELAQLREQWAQLEARANDLSASVAAERESRAQAERAATSSQQELRAQALTWQEERRTILRDLELLRQVRTAPVAPVVVAPAPKVASPRSRGGLGDRLAALLRHRAARTGLIAYVALVHILFLMMLSIHSK